ncbi:lipid A deacylase LpxR family protein [Dyadobacter sp. CY356]|uniref:lipid A deacylase LpxR family protein n=1 Tax=Dyadobacter sp. CY356 TaxID=2906442 RepID=UPI001F1868C5|nr:lipid A deacylase LpxR family protein [Dyadobacter sp. CY356]MCF0055963.1 lipid A deacylase LpxR family protein [Dyadobacter sp. CY356]
MKKALRFLYSSLFLVLTGILPSVGQEAEPTRMFRFYEDNDFLNVRGLGTDRSYTNGVRLDLFYNKKKPARFSILPHAGAKSIDTYGWSVMQVMVTPEDISIPGYQPDDYPYSGALFVTHSLSSYNKDKKYSFQTELIAGIRGPASFAEQTQKLIHRTIHDRKPMGWQNQTSSKILLNVNFTAEKQLAAFKGLTEVMGGAKITAGTMMNSLTIYPLIRFGKMNPYFNGFLSQFSKANGSNHKTQLYLFLKPKLTWMASNAILHGSIQHNSQPERDTKQVYTPDVENFLGEVEFGTVINFGNFSITYTQKPSTAYSKGLYSHNVGNISVYFSW